MLCLQIDQERWQRCSATRITRFDHHEYAEIIRGLAGNLLLESRVRLSFTVVRVQRLHVTRGGLSVLADERGSAGMRREHRSSAVKGVPHGPPGMHPAAHQVCPRAAAVEAVHHQHSNGA
jgi:hypothetical protein